MWRGLPVSGKAEHQREERDELAEQWLQAEAMTVGLVYAVELFGLEMGMWLGVKTSAVGSHFG